MKETRKKLAKYTIPAVNRPSPSEWSRIVKALDSIVDEAVPMCGAPERLVRVLERHQILLVRLRAVMSRYRLTQLIEEIGDLTSPRPSFRAVH